ncbi:MAG: DNA polymerase III subunit delta [Syntrophobacterales bacterium]|nr:DNA polymerase III subunit delta [Syntrophobacterales bacterium]
MAAHKEDAVEASSFKEVIAELARGKAAPPCFLLYGEEEFQLQDALDKIVDTLLPVVKERDFNLFATDGEHEDVGALCEALITPPLLPGRKVVIVKNTRLFDSKNNLPQLISRIRERLESDPVRATAEFMQFLALAGLQLDDLRDGGWRKMDDEGWQKLVPGDDGGQREAWLPRIVEIAVDRKAAPVVKRPDEAERLERILSGGMPAANHLILTAPGADRRKKLFKTIAAVGRILVFEKIKKELKQQQTVMELAAASLARSGKKISGGGWETLGKKTGFSLRESLGAIEKLITYAGENAVIEAADVEAVVGRTKEDVIFALTGAISARKLPDALTALRELLEQGEAPLMIFAMLTREIRLLLQARLLIDAGRLKSFNANTTDYGRFQRLIYPSLKQPQAEDQLDLVSQHPFVVFQALKNAARFTRRELIAYLGLLAQTDLELKSTNLPQPLLLERFLVSSCRPGLKVS